MQCQDPPETLSVRNDHPEMAEIRKTVADGRLPRNRGLAGCCPPREGDAAQAWNRDMSQATGWKAELLDAITRGPS